MTNGAHPQSDRLGSFTDIISAVKTPLGFSSLVVLVVAVVVLAAAKAFPQQQTWLLMVAVVWISVAVLGVPVLAYVKPEALYGQRPWQPLFARQLADDVYMALEGAMANLPAREQLEAWTSLADYVGSTDEPSQKDFAQEFAVRLRRRADLGAKRLTPGGRIQAFDRASEEPPGIDQTLRTPIDVNLEMERLRSEVASLNALRDRVIGVLAAGRSLSLNELKSRLEIRTDDSNRIAELQACLGELVGRGIVEHYFGSIEDYTLSSDWLRRKERS